MDAPSRWQRVRELFARSLEEPDDTRDVWLRSACADDPDVLAEVRRLLAQRSEPASIFSEDAQALLARMACEPVADVLLDTDIGPYRLRRLLGVGGMGRVYLAERTTGDFRQQVALKLVRSEFATSELRQRFLRERNTLARLAHPNVAQLHDGGVATDGAPYFTLEYIEGEPITRWCDAHACDVRARVALMLKVCDAVLHAHRSLIVHRDLKPSNILVNADGEPKLLDFGIAKPLDDAAASETLTNADARPMTRDYAAPEQLLGDPVTTATDIYALGVLLYLLLSGHMPYRRAELGQISWIKAILEDAPEAMERAIERSDADATAKSRATSPTALGRALRGDLERIVQRALAKKADSRYPTVDRLADDLRAYLAGRAISGGTRTYRLRKFVRRHWLPLTASAAVLLLIIASSIGLAWQSRRIAAEAQSTAAVKDFLLNLFRGADPDQTRGHEISARELVDRGADRLVRGMQDQPLLRGELESVVGRIYNDLGLPEKAEPLEGRAIDDLRASGAEPAVLAQSETEHARALYDKGEYDSAMTVNQRAVTRLRGMRSPPPGQFALALAQQSSIKIAFHKFDEAAAISDEAVSLARRSGVPGETLADVLRIAAVAARGMRDADRSEQLQREVIALHRTARGDNDSSVAIDYDELGELLDAAGRMADELDARAEASRIGEAQMGNDDPRLVQVRLNYAGILRLFGRFAESKTMLDKAGAFFVAAKKDDVGLETDRASLARAEGDYAAAETYERAALDTLKSMTDEQPFLELEIKWGIAHLHGLQGKPDEAANEIAQLMADSGSLPLLGVNISIIRAEIMRMRGDFTGSEKILREALATLEHRHRNQTFEYVRIKESLAETLAHEGKTAEAEQEVRTAMTRVEQMSRGQTMTISTQLIYDLAELRAAQPDGATEASELAQRALREFTQTYGADSSRAKDAQAFVAKLQARPGAEPSHPVSTR